MEQELRIWNAAVTARPAVVRRPASVAEIAEAVTEAQSRELGLSVRGGGHDWAGRAVKAGGLTIDLGALRSVTIDGDVAIIGGGASSGDVIAAAAASGQSAATGIVGAVGMAGLTLGGGYGPLTGVAGLAADNLIEAEVVLADGTVVTAGEAGDSDLLWALRGGGGNFGVVASMRVRLHPIPQLYRAMIFFPLDQAADVLAGYDELAAGLPDELTAQGGVVSTPDGTPVLLMAPSWSGDPAAGPDWAKRFENLGTPVVSQSGLFPYGEVLRIADQRFAPDNRRYEIRTLNLPQLSSEVVALFIAAGRSRTSALSALNFHHFHGAAARVGPTETAFGQRREHYMTEIIASWRPDDGVDETAHRRWAAETAERLGAHALPGGYPNLIGPDQTVQASQAYGPNAQRLAALKDRYDPGHVFTAIPLPTRGHTSHTSHTRSAVDA